MNVKRREHIAAPYACYNGAMLNATQCESYNAIQDDINRWIDAGRPVPEWLLDWSHRYFVTASEVSLECEKIKPIVEKLNHAGRFSVSPKYSVFGTTAFGEYDLLTTGSNVRHIAETALRCAIKGNYAGIEVRCDGIRCEWA